MNDIVVTISECKVKISNLTNREEDGMLVFDFKIEVLEGDKTADEINGDVIDFMKDVISCGIQKDVF